MISQAQELTEDKRFYEKIDQNEFEDVD